MADETKGTKPARRSNAAQPPPAPEPVEIDWQGTPMFGCPFCGRNNESKEWTQEHIAYAHPGEGEGS